MSIRHIVLFKFRSGVTWADPRVAEAARMSKSHGQHIDEIQEWWAGPDVYRRDNSYDFAVMGLFADHDALSRYQAHPHHQKGTVLWRELATWIVLDLDEERARQETS
ncbi:MAG TPA: Dabb family protein [Actinophytocola sp.]|jgi:hypothetical protein|uniref:Dabb family protein n=1 Tax=Actinophytocola sp. TaxID=1872138 RepID=UPI002DFBE77B|nr:Dabb family protein [Actinophytocola sp.]